jgi:anaerobic ribonucleoside-triphosphate reductase activating protein
MDDQKIRLHHTTSSSLVNGPGNRFVIWTQGCYFNCPGCFNPDTFSPKGGQEYSVDDLAGDILACRTQIEGITLSGGEPLLQHQSLLRLLSRVHQSASLGVLLFTGFTWDELQHIPNIQPLFAEIDLVIAGRYQQSQHQGHHLVGSTNKTFHYLTSRYHPADLEIPPAEVVISPDGVISLSGIDPLIW